MGKKRASKSYQDESPPSPKNSRFTRRRRIAATMANLLMDRRIEIAQRHDQDEHRQQVQHENIAPLDMEPITHVVNVQAEADMVQ